MTKASPAVREAAAAAFAQAKAKDLARLAEDLFAVAALLGREHRLRRALTDPGVPVEARRALLSDVVGDRLTKPAMPVLAAALELQRTRDREVVGVLEELAAEAAFARADAEGELDRMEDELFRLRTAIQGSPDLQMALADPGVPDDRKAAVVTDLLEGRATQGTVRLVRFVMEAGHSRELAQTLGELAGLAAARRGELVAEVRTPVELDAARRRSLAEALSRAVGRSVRIQEVVDPTVVGSLSVRVGDEVFDGSVKRQLELARERLGAA
jgi:F-type H+-transporting ATPase subunit delta